MVRVRAPVLGQRQTVRQTIALTDPSSPESRLQTRRNAVVAAEGE